MINNIKQLRELLPYHQDGDNIFNVLIIHRKKDSPKNKGKLVDRFIVRSYEQLYSIMPDIVNSCEQHKARAYINLNPKSEYKILLTLNTIVARKIFNNDTSDLKNIFWKALGNTPTVKECRTWVVDIDLKDKVIIERIHDYIDELSYKYSNKNAVIKKIETKQGCHLITRPFNLKDFHDAFPDIEVKKDHPTLLYLPESVEKL